MCVPETRVNPNKRVGSGRAHSRVRPTSTKQTVSESPRRKQHPRSSKQSRLREPAAETAP
eukprot:2170207-Pyramimonas_sp.AAC.1